MRCGGCGHENPESARFCNACGAGLEAGCPECGQANPPGSRFCNACGATLDAPVATRRDPRDYTPRHLAERILDQKSAIEGERKHVTVLFADLVDSSALAERADPEDVHALFDRAFRIILDRVHGYEGTVNQFTGDGVMALFGAPLALEDAPRRSVVAGLAIQRGLEELDAEVQQRFGRRFRMRIGIHTGLVVVGKIGDDLRMDYTAVGDTTNLAARLEALAEPGAVVISETTARLSEGFFELRPLPPTPVKGRSEPVRAFEVLRARPVTSRIDVLEESGEGLTAYVGREREIDLLGAAFAQAKAGRGQVAFVVGEAGIGKSRILRELRRRIDAEPHVWMEGHCASYARSTPFHAIADAARRRHGIDDRDDEGTALAKLETLERELGGELGWTLPYLRRLLSLPSGDPAVDALDAMTRRAEMCRALQARLLRPADRMPQVLVIEDLHWVDAATEEFLAFLSDSIAAARVLLILTHRPGYVHPFGDRSFHVRVPLQALDREAMAQMVRGILEAIELPETLQQRIAEKAEGNPFFVEEVMRSLLEEGVLRLRDGSVLLTRDLADVSIPDRIQDVLMARLDRLSDEPKRAIQVASVIGREFAMRLLSRIHEAAGRLEGVVNELRSLELIYEKTLHPELAYMFKHALTHEVAYESVLVQRRKALHRNVGFAIEDLYADRIAEHYEALAHHFAEAEEWDRALRYHELASEKSAVAYANQAAVHHCQCAIEIAERLGDVDRARLRALHTRLGGCAWMTSAFGISGDAFRRAGELAAGPPEAAMSFARAAFSQLWNHDYSASKECEARALELARAPGAEAARVVALVSQDEWDLVQGKGLEEERRAGEALALAERTGDAAPLVMVLAHLGQRAQWRGEYRRCLAYTSRAVALAEQSGAPGDANFAAWFLGIAAVCLGEYRRGLEVLSGALTVCDRIGDRAIKARLLNTLGWAHAEFGCNERAAEFNRAATQIGREAVGLGLVAGAPELYANGAINLAGNWLALGRLDEAEAELAPIQRQCETDPDPWMQWRWSTHLVHHQARLALARGEPARALELSERDVEASHASHASKLVCRAQELRGRILLAMDDREAAARSLQTALDVASRIEHPSVAWRAHALLAELARRRGERAAADAHGEAVRSLFERLAPALPEPALRAELGRLGQRLIEDPLAALR